jgi:hypothetical protein
MAIKNRIGAGYSIEAILSAVILFTFAIGALQAPQEKDWSSFQREVAAKDLSFVLKRTGSLNTFLKNSDTGAIRTASTVISARDLRVSGTVENLPLNELSVGFHTMPSDIAKNFTEPVESSDHCFGDLGEISSQSEYEILKTNSSQFLENKHGVRLYFADTDPRMPTGFDGEENYDSVWVDNGTRCVFTPSEGPYRLNQIFLWGNTTDSDPEGYYDFKSFDNTSNSFTVYSADKAKAFDRVLSRPLNGIETDTSVDTFNFSTQGIRDFDVIVFQENESLDRIETYETSFRNFLSGGSVMFLMNMSQADTEHEFMEDIGFEWMDVDYNKNSVPDYEATFSEYEVSEEVETYFTGLEGTRSEVSLKPGGKVISAQSSTMTSRNDILYARNVAYDTSVLDGEKKSGESWSTHDGGGTCGSDTETNFVFLNETFQEEEYEVHNVNLAETSSNCGADRRGLEIDKDRDGNFEGPYLVNEIVKMHGRRYVPRIESGTSASFVFAGSKKVELINHREVLEGMDGGRVARAAYEEDYSQADMRMLASTLYWIRGDQVQFQGQSTGSALSTTIIGGVKENVFMPYKLEMRWSE